MIAQATLPEAGFDGNRIRDSLSSLRLGHDGLEQFVGLLFDEFDALREELESDQTSVDEERQALQNAQAQIAAERQQFETDRQHWNDALQKRVVELERDKLSLAAELESERRRSEEAAKAVAEQQRQFAAERAEWMAEVRQLRDRSKSDQNEHAGEIPRTEFNEGDANPVADTLEQCAPKNSGRKAKSAATAPAVPVNVIQPPKAPAFNPFESDPVMGPLMSQFQLLQRDVARRREKKS
jgi:hypothetical protein